MVDTAIGIKYIYMAESCDEETKPVVKTVCTWWNSFMQYIKFAYGL
jgi:hypothetical protein